MHTSTRSLSAANLKDKDKVTKRARSSSIVSVTESPEHYDDTLDQGALNNVNADWVNYKGALRCWLERGEAQVQRRDEGA